MSRARFAVEAYAHFAISCKTSRESPVRWIRSQYEPFHRPSARTCLSLASKCDRTQRATSARLGIMDHGCVVLPSQPALHRNMSDTALAISPIQAGSPRIQPNTPRKTKISAQLRSAIEAMVWLGLKRDDAAQHAGMKDNSLYVALRRPDVKAAYLSECEVLRVSGRARRIHRLEAMVEQDDNKAAVINAALALDRIGEIEAGRLSANSLPGLQIVIVQGGAVSQVSTTGAMTIEHDGPAAHKPSD